MVPGTNDVPIIAVPLILTTPAVKVLPSKFVVPVNVVVGVNPIPVVYALLASTIGGLAFVIVVSSDPITVILLPINPQHPTLPVIVVEPLLKIVPDVKTANDVAVPNDNVVIHIYEYHNISKYIIIYQ